MTDPRDRRRLVLMTLVGTLIITGLALVDKAIDGEGEGVAALPSAPVSTEPGLSPEPTSESTAPSSTAVDLPIPTVKPLPPTAQVAGVQLRVESTVKIPLLTAMKWAPREGAYYATAQDGFVHRVPEDLSTSEVVLDGTDFITDYVNLSERGLFGIAFDPVDGRMLLHYTDKASNSHVSSFAMVDGKPDVASKRQILYLEQPGPGHQGGGMHFDDQGTLYVSFGDGGGSRGRDAQDYATLYGAIVRIIPNRDVEGYTVPPDNPYVNDPDRRDELWAKGLRNPFGFSIDPANGDMWIGDVGEDTREEINYMPAGTSGLNFGWYWFEGSLKRDSQGDPPSDLTLTPPIHDWGRDQGVSSIGGHVYHGTAIPGLSGAYIFADMSGPLFGYGAEGATRLTAAGSGVITGFTETPERELLVLSLNRGVFRLLPA